MPYVAAIDLLASTLWDRRLYFVPVIIPRVIMKVRETHAEMRGVDSPGTRYNVVKMLEMEAMGNSK